MKRFLSLGAGVQSSTLALMAEHGDIEPVDGAIFADTQAEPEEVYRWLDWLETKLSYPIHRVTAGSLQDDSLILRTSKKTGNRYIRALIPAFYKTDKGRGLLGRKCTAEYKVRALIKKQRQLAAIPSGCKEVRITTLIGISYDEVERMKRSQEPWVENTWPLIDLKMTRQDCKDWMKNHGYPEPPRSACRFCPFHSDAEWMRLRDEQPVEWQKAVWFDHRLRELAREQTGSARLQGDTFLHSSLVPLDQVEFKDRPSHQQVDMFNNECEGMCGV